MGLFDKKKKVKNLTSEDIAIDILAKPDQPNSTELSISLGQVVQGSVKVFRDKIGVSSNFPLEEEFMNVR